jgi:hypothetical protein
MEEEQITDVEDLNKAEIEEGGSKISFFSVSPPEKSPIQIYKQEQKVAPKPQEVPLPIAESNTEAFAEEIKELFEICPACNGKEEEEQVLESGIIALMKCRRCKGHGVIPKQDKVIIEPIKEEEAPQEMKQVEMVVIKKPTKTEKFTLIHETEATKEEKPCPKCNGKIIKRTKIIKKDGGIFAVFKIRCRNTRKSKIRFWRKPKCDYFIEIIERVD